MLLTQWRCELTPYSQRAHIEYLMLGSFWGHSVSSQWTHKMSSCCELSVSLQLTQWAHCYHCMVSSLGWSHDLLTVWVSVSCKLMESSQQAHGKSSSCEFTVSYLSVHKMSSPWDSSGEVSMSMVLAHTFTRLRAQWNTCELWHQAYCLLEKPSLDLKLNREPQVECLL